MRVYKRDLDAMIKRLNASHGIESPQWNTVGSYKLYKDICGYSVHKVINESGGVHSIGYGMTTKECYFALLALLDSE